MGLNLQVALNSTNKLNKDEKSRWFHTLLFMLVKLDNLVSLRSLVSGLEMSAKKLDIDVLLFIQNLFVAILDDRMVDTENMISYIDKDDDEDLFYKLKKSQQQKMIELQNILYIGYYFKNFRANYLSETLISKIPTKTRGESFPMLLDKYIPYNKNLKVALANVVTTNITLLESIVFHGNYGMLNYNGVYTNIKLYQKVMQLNLYVFKKSLFLKTFFSMAMAMDMDMAMDMARAMARDKNLYEKFIIFNLYASATLFAKEAQIDLEISKQELASIVKNPLGFFSELTLTEEEKRELDEVLEKSSILPMLGFILKNTEYENFDKKDEKQALMVFHAEIKVFNKRQLQ